MAAAGEPRLRQAGGVEYLLVRKRVTNLNLRVDRAGRALVSAPAWAPLAQIDAFVAARAGWVLKARQKALADETARAAAPVPSREECLAVFKPVSEAVFPLFAGVLGGERPVLKVRDMRSRWGVCHPQKRQITLAARLALQPMAAIQYVVVHEYCHFVHPDHQAGFWALVERVLPDYKARRALLKSPR